MNVLEKLKLYSEHLPEVSYSSAVMHDWRLTLHTTGTYNMETHVPVTYVGTIDNGATAVGVANDSEVNIPGEIDHCEVVLRDMIEEMPTDAEKARIKNYLPVASYDFDGARTSIQLPCEFIFPE